MIVIIMTMMVIVSTIRLRSAMLRRIRIRLWNNE